MMPLWRPGTPHGGDLSGHDEYAMWDAAYVLGSLSSLAGSIKPVLRSTRRCRLIAGRVFPSWSASSPARRGRPQ